MSWLKGKKTEFDKAKAEQEAKEQAEREASQRRHDYSVRRMKQESQRLFGDLVGKTCIIDGKKHKLRVEEDEKYAQTTLMADDQKVASIHFWEREESEYDSDGCSWGTGNYRSAASMHFYLPHKTKYGNKDKEYYEYLSEDYLAEYLLQFVKV